MKKFGLFAVLAFGGLLFAGCKDKENEKEPQKPSNPEDAVLVDNTYQSINVFGNNRVVNGETEVDNDWAVKEFNGMTAISLTSAKSLNQDLYNTLKTKSVKGLYKFEGLVLGTKDAGWDVAKVVDGEKVSVNGSYAFKACGCDQDEDEEWIKTCHFPSAESHGESLTPSTLFITSNMSAEADANGFDHNSNPVALEAGVYTVVLATYKAPVGDMGITCGLGLIKTADREAFVPAETYPVTAMDLAGDFNGWGSGDAAPLTKNGNAYEGQVTLAAAGALKVRLNNDWKYSLGAHALSDQEYQDNDGNIELAAGTYSIHVELSAGAYADFLTDQTIVSFTIAA